MEKISVKKITGLMLVCLALLATGAAAAGLGDSPEVLTAMVQQSRYYNGLQNMIEKLNTDEHIAIDVQVIPDTEYLNMLRMKLNSGEAPDLIDYNIPAIYDIVDSEKNFVDLSKEPWVSRLLLPENVTCQADGKIYAFPFLGVPGVHGFIYNRDVFEKAGAEIPQTWEELLRVCERIRKAGVVPIFMPKDSWVPQTLMSDNFARVLGPEGAQEFAGRLMKGEARWTDIPEFATVIDMYLELYEKGYVNEDFATASYEDAVFAVADGDAAMHFNGDFFAASVLEENPGANIGMFAVSMLGEAEVVTENMSSPGFAIYKNTRKIDMAKKVLALWSTPAYADLYFKDRPGFPAFEGVDGGRIPPYLDEMDEKYISQGKMVPEWNYYVMNLNALFESSLYLYYVDAPTRDDMDGTAILKKFQGDFEQYMRDQGDSG